MQFHKINTLIRQFGQLNALRFLCAELTRKVFDPYNISSYSQTGEDRIIGSLLGDIGFYVDVGCNHPQAFSNTFFLYKKGWTGIAIDANEGLIQKHRELRKKDTSICAAVSNEEQEVVFTDFENALVSSLDADHISKWEKIRSVKEKRIVTTKLLGNILANYEVPCHFDLLCIDVEGHDFEVLSSLDLNSYRPKLIVIEMHGFDLLDPNVNDIYTYLSANHYKMIGYIVMNGYFSDTAAQSNGY